MSKIARLEFSCAILDEVGFASKSELAKQMLQRAFEAGVSASWVTGDTVYGNHRKLRLWLEEKQQPFVLAVPCNESLMWQGPTDTQEKKIAETLPIQAWHSLSAGTGSKGERWYQWALTPLFRLQPTAAERYWGHYY